MRAVHVALAATEAKLRGLRERLRELEGEKARSPGCDHWEQLCETASIYPRIIRTELQLWGQRQSAASLGMQAESSSMDKLMEG